MREILFRGKCVSDGHWVHGLLISIGGELSMLTSNNGLDRAYPVLSETVGQYTGLTDKNGKKIFEGDIFTDGISNYVVTFTNGAFTIDYRPDFLAHFLVSGFADGDIIGNIHDNPELLEVAE